MQFRVDARVAIVALDAVERALHALDPAAIVDLAGSGDQLRVSTWMSMVELRRALDRAGIPLTHDQLVALPSECCGGCGG